MISLVFGESASKSPEALKAWQETAAAIAFGAAIFFKSTTGNHYDYPPNVQQTQSPTYNKSQNGIELFGQSSNFAAWLGGHGARERTGKLHAQNTNLIGTIYQTSTSFTSIVGLTVVGPVESTTKI